MFIINYIKKFYLKFHISFSLEFQSCCSLLIFLKVKIYYRILNKSSLNSKKLNNIKKFQILAIHFYITAKTC